VARLWVSKKKEAKEKGAAEITARVLPAIISRLVTKLWVIGRETRGRGRARARAIAIAIAIANGKDRKGDGG
jgi:hypothetical protein